MSALYLEDFRRNIDAYDIKRPEVFRRFLIADNHPLKIHLDKIYQENISSYPSVVSLMKDETQKFFSKNFSTSDLGLEVRRIESFAEKWFIKGSDLPRRPVSGGAYAIGYGDQDNLLRIPMRYLLENAIDHSGLSADFVLPEKRYWHIPGKPEEINNQNYFVLAKEVKALTEQETAQALVHMPHQDAERLITSLLKIAIRVSFVDAHLRNVRLAKKEGQWVWVILDTEPIGSHALIFSREVNTDGVPCYTQEDRLYEAGECVKNFKEYFKYRVDNDYDPIIEIIDQVAQRELNALNRYLVASDEHISSRASQEVLPEINSPSLCSKLIRISLIALKILFFFITIPYMLIQKGRVSFST